MSRHPRGGGDPAEPDWIPACAGMTINTDLTFNSGMTVNSGMTIYTSINAPVLSPNFSSLMPARCISVSSRLACGVSCG